MLKSVFGVSIAENQYFLTVMWEGGIYSNKYHFKLIVMWEGGILGY
jgi:hypothetical protein